MWGNGGKCGMVEGRRVHVVGGMVGTFAHFSTVVTPGKLILILKGRYYQRKLVAKHENLLFRAKRGYERVQLNFLVMDVKDVQTRIHLPPYLHCSSRSSYQIECAHLHP